MVLFHASDIIDYKAELPRRVEGTCCWILKHPQYVSWVSTQDTTILWITGHPGCGKTILSAYLTEHLDTQGTERHELVCCFFCDDKIATQRDAKAILRSIIYQMLRHRRYLLRHVKAAYDIQGSQLVHSFEALWNIFIAITSDDRSGPINVVVDAIDECEEKTRVRFLDAITKLVHQAKVASDPLPNCIKFVITSRPSLSMSYDFNEFWRNRLPMEESQAGISKDLQLVIKRRVNEIVERCGCTPKTKEFLEQALYSQAGQTFLWVKIILRCLETSLLASTKDFQNILSTLPQDLEVVYENFLRSIPTENQALATKILHVLVGSPRYLTLEEMNILLTIETDHRTVADVEADCQPSIGRTVQGILGPLIRVSESKISLVHQSAKEFLLDLATRPEHPLASTFGVDETKAALILASSCISYLLLQNFAVDHFSHESSSSENSSERSPIFGEMGMQSEEIHFDPLALENDIILRDQYVVEGEVCQSLANHYKLFDYSAIYWAENFSLCERIAPQELQESAIQLTEKPSCHLTNWLRYFWLKTGLEFALSDDFDSLTLASFFNQRILLTRLLGENGFYEQRHKDRALFWAARMGSRDAAELLLRNGAVPDSMTVDQQTPLSVAAQQGHLDIVKLLLADERTDVNLRVKSGRSSLSWAAGNGHLPVVQFLKDFKYCRLDEQDHSQWTPLLWAVGGNHLDVVSALLDSNGSVNMNHTDRTGRSAFSWAAGDGLSTVLTYFLQDSQLEPNLLDKRGRSALSWAAGNGHTEAVRVLVKSKRCDKSSKDDDCRNAISWACKGGHDKVLKILIKYGCPGIDDEDVDGWTPLAWALENRSPGTIETLVSTGLVDIERRDHNGRTALSWAAYYGYLEVVRILLREGADANTSDSDGRTPLSGATAYGYSDVIQELHNWLD
jgi:ankyrin repeat protein